MSELSLPVRFAAQLLHSVGDHEVLQNCLAELQSSFRASNASITIIDRRLPQHSLYVASNIDRDSIDRYLLQFGEDPWYRSTIGRSGVMLALGSDLVPQREYRRSRTYADFNRPLGLEHLATAGYFSHELDVVLITNGTVRRGNFARSDLSRLGMLLPHAV